MAKKISLVNMKGGVGKSTLTAQLAYEFANRQTFSKRVLVIDIDPQFNVSQYLLGPDKYEAKILNNDAPTTWNIFEQHTRIPGQPAPTPLDAESIIQHVLRPPDSNLRGGILDLAPSRLELAYSLRNTTQKNDLLQRFVKAVEASYDIMFIDCPPTESLFTIAAYMASDYILIPVKPEYLSAIGLPLLSNSLDEFKSLNGSAPNVAGIVYNFADGYAPEERKTKKTVKEIAGKYGWYLFENEVPYSRSMAKSAREGKPLRWTSNARNDRIIKLEEVTRELAGKIGL